MANGCSDWKMVKPGSISVIMHTENSRIALKSGEDKCFCSLVNLSSLSTIFSFFCSVFLLFGMGLLKIRNCFSDSRNHCKKVLKDEVNNVKNCRSVASQLIGSCDFWRICNSVLNRGKSPLFNDNPLDAVGNILSTAVKIVVEIQL